MAALTIPVQIKTATASGQTPTSLLAGELGLDPWLGRLWWADNNGNKQFAALPAIANAANAAQADDVRQLMIQMAMLRGKAANYASGFADDYADQSGVDTANSVAAYDATNKWFTNTYTGGGTVSGTSTAISDSDYSGYPKANAFDGNTGSCWVTGAGQNAAGVAYIGQDFGASVTKSIISVAFTSFSNTANTFASGLFQYSDTGASNAWTTAATLSLPTAASASQTYSIPSVGAHRFWRLLCNTNNGSYNIGVGELTMTAQGTLNALDLRSVSAPASSVPSKASILVLVQALNGGTITPNTNLIASVTRTRSATTPTWTQATLVAAGTFAGFSVYEANAIDISGQPSGQSMGTRLQTASGLAIAAQADVMQWAA